MKKLRDVVFQVTVIVLISLTLLEVGLRLVPTIIPPLLLKRFEPNLRSKIAKGRFLTYGETVLLPRDDKGPPIHLVTPRTAIRWNNVDGQKKMYSSTVDDVGFCNPPNRYHKSPIHLIVLGDSFTWCHAINPLQTWSEELFRNLGFSTYNLGRGGQGLYEYLQIFKAFGLKKSPQLVIMAVYEGNDLRGALKYFSYQEKSKKKLRKISKPFRSLFRNNSYVANLIYATVRETRKWLKGDEGIDFRYRLLLKDQEVLFNEENTDLGEVRHATRLQEGLIDLTVFDKALETYVALAKENDFLPIVTYLPAAYSTYQKQIQFNDPKLKEIMLQFSQKQRAFFKQRGDSLGYVFLDTTPNLQIAATSTDSKKMLYFRRSLHLSPYGHEVVGKILTKELNTLAKRYPNRFIADQ